MFKIDEARKAMVINNRVAGSMRGFMQVETIGEVKSELVPFGLAVC